MNKPQLYFKLAVCALTLLCTNTTRATESNTDVHSYHFVTGNYKANKGKQLLSPSHTYQLLTDTTHYSTSNHLGYDLADCPSRKSNAPHFISMQVPDGNYKVTVTVGSRYKAGCTTVRAESRRLMAQRITTKKGEYKNICFVVNKRTPVINEKESVRIKPREKTKLNWDDKLTLEFNGPAPVVAAVSVVPDYTTPTIFLCGNSTVVDQDEEPWASWGQMIPSFFNDNVAFANFAESGECANTFMAAKRLDKALSMMKPGDYLIMEFAHNDQKQKGPGVGAYYSFATSIKTYIDLVRAKGGHPILVTPTRRRMFKDGRMTNTHSNYPEAIHWIAEKENVPLIDLQESTRILFEAMGEEGSKRAYVHYPAGTYPGQTKPFADNTHFNPYGAYEIAKCVVEGMKQLNLPFITHLRSNYKTFTPSQPDDADNFTWDASPFVYLTKPDGN